VDRSPVRGQTGVTMRHTSWCASLLGIALLLVMSVGSAHAQATRTWVSGVGDDANPCSRTAPCKTFAGAISKTAAGGEISVLDPGGFGAVTITKSISIINDYSGEAGILASGTNGITVNASATDVVILRGLVIDGAPPATPGLNGVRFIAGGALHIEKCLIKNFANSGAGNGNGVLFVPALAAGTTTKLFISETIFANNGAGSNGGAVTVKPTGAGTVKVTVVNSEAVGNITGFTADGSGSTGIILVDVVNSVSSGNTSGMVVATAAAGSALTVMMADRTSLVNNTTGVSSTGPKSFSYLTNSTVFGNSTGLVSSSGGSILSYQHNNINGGNSPTDGAPTGPLTQN